MYIPGKRTAKLMLFSAALIWGSTFVFIKSSLDDVDPFFLTAMRFTIGAAVLALALGPKKLKTVDRATVKAGAVIGAFLFLGFAIQTIGMVGTTPSKNAFLSSCYGALVPIVGWVFQRKRPELRQILAAAICVLGVGVISLNEGFGAVVWGDIVSFLSAFFYASQFIATEKYGHDHDIYLISMLEFAFAGLYGWVGQIALHGMPTFSGISGGTWFAILYLGVMASSVAFLFQNVGQISTDPASASLILSLECVFGTIIAVLFYGDVLTVKLLIGFTLVFLGVLYSETGFAFLRKKPATKT